MKKYILTACLAAIGLSSAVPTPILAQIPSRSLGSEIDSIMTAYFQAGKFNGSILIAMEGRIVYAKNWGYADMESREALNSDSQYYIASITKIFTSTAVHLLEKQGRLSMDDRITQYLSDLPHCFTSVRIRHLLSHTAGIPSEPGDWRRLVNTDNSDVMQFLNTVEELDFEPGTAYQYSNNGYVLLAELIERISGQSYKMFIEKYIFKPAGMDQSFVVARNLPKGDLHVARSYVNGKQADWPLYRLGPAGIYTTPEDLFRFDQAFFSHRYFNPGEVKKILTPVEVDGKAQYYGLGWGVLDMRGERYLGHTGGTFGFRTLYEHQLKGNNTLILFSNVGDLTPTMEIRNKLNQVLSGNRRGSGYLQ